MSFCEKAIFVCWVLLYAAMLLALALGSMKLASILSIIFAVVFIGQIVWIISKT